MPRFSKEDALRVVFTAICLLVAWLDYPETTKPSRYEFLGLIGFAFLPWALPWAVRVIKSVKLSKDGLDRKSVV